MTLSSFVDRDRFAVAGVALAGGVFASLAGLRPTGSAGVDLVLVLIAGATCVFVGASAPWWSITAAAAIVAAASGGLFSLALAAAGGLVAAVAGVRGERWPHVQVVMAGAVAATVIASTRLDVPGPFGVESAVALVVCLWLTAFGVAAQQPRARRWMLVAFGAVAAVAALASAGFGAAAASAGDDLRAGNTEARSGLRALSHGDLDEAADWFDAAAQSFDRADSRLDRIWTQPARLVPFVAQHRAAGVTLADSAADASELLGTTLSAVDVDSVRLIDGRIDLGAVAELEQQLVVMQGGVESLATALDEADNPWLVEPLRQRMDDLAGEIDERRAQGDDALLALRTAPSLLGADAPKVYLIAFVTPVEARGSVGFMGNVAEVTVDAGRVELTAFRRHDELHAADPASWRIEGMPEFIERYGRYGFATGPGGSADGDVWKIVTMSPHFPSTAEVISQLYPESGGRPIDGVVAVDPTVIAALLEFTGPIDVEGAPTLTHRNAAQYLHFDQYVELDRPERVDMLEVLGLAAIDRLLAGALPGPVELGRTLAPLAEDGHLAAWFDDDTAQHLAETIDVDHGLPPLDGGDGVAVAINNGSASKIEVFLDADVTYRRHVDPSNGRLEGRLTVALTNNAPSSGLPDYLIGNAVGLPLGSSRPLLSLYAPSGYTSATIDGEPVQMSVETEQGWAVMGTTLDLGPGQTRVVEITFDGQIDVSGGVPEPVTMLPNLVRTPTLTVETTFDGT